MHNRCSFTDIGEWARAVLFLYRSPTASVRGSSGGFLLWWIKYDCINSLFYLYIYYIYKEISNFQSIRGKRKRRKITKNNVNCIRFAVGENRSCDEILPKPHMYYFRIVCCWKIHNTRAARFVLLSGTIKTNTCNLINIHANVSVYFNTHSHIRSNE